MFGSVSGIVRAASYSSDEGSLQFPSETKYATFFSETQLYGYGVTQIVQKLPPHCMITCHRELGNLICIQTSKSCFQLLGHPLLSSLMMPCSLQ
jgi:hypothetical protein